ncbi:MAG: ribonuclease H-like YkuK family protein [bacterium]|nr:ribonuclease H-like YkuK family protein [bacterium]
MKQEFKKLGGLEILDLGKYVRDYLEKYPDTTVYVGTDSQTAGAHTRFVTVVAMYDEIRKDGVHYVFSRCTQKREKDTFSKMWKEIEMSLEVSEYLETELEGFARRLSPEELIEIKSNELTLPVRLRCPSKSTYDVHQTKLVNVDVDINPFLGGGKNKSHVAYVAAKSYLTGMGYRARFKPNAWCASCAADFRLKKGGGNKRRRKKKDR